MAAFGGRGEIHRVGVSACGCSSRGRVAGYWSCLWCCHSDEGRPVRERGGRSVERTVLKRPSLVVDLLTKSNLLSRHDRATVQGFRPRHRPSATAQRPLRLWPVRLSRLWPVRLSRLWPQHPSRLCCPRTRPSRLCCPRTRGPDHVLSSCGQNPARGWILAIVYI